MLGLGFIAIFKYCYGMGSFLLYFFDSFWLWYLSAILIFPSKKKKRRVALLDMVFDWDVIDGVMYHRGAYDLLVTGMV